MGRFGEGKGVGKVSKNIRCYYVETYKLTVHVISCPLTLVCPLCRRKLYILARRFPLVIDRDIGRVRDGGIGSPCRVFEYIMVEDVGIDRQKGRI